MLFNRVEVSQFRNLTSATLLPSPSINLISGSNGSGKSSLLEALYYLATGSSFRSHRLNHIIQKERPCSTLFAEVFDSSSHRIGLMRCRDGSHESRINGETISKRSSLVQLIPLQIISPETISILLEGSEYRRSFIDWGLFHVEQMFHYHLSNYSRVLKQRNALLKSQPLQQIEQWDAQLIEHGNHIDRYRRQYVDVILPYLKPLLNEVLPDITFEFRYRSGWSEGTTFKESLKQAINTDIKMRHTTVGPHRGDLSIRTESGRVSDILSRGQLKLVVMAMKLAQILLLANESSHKPVILIDDIAAELDVLHRELLLGTLSTMNCQIFITTPQESLVNLSEWEEKKVFHVEHGHVKEVV